MGKRAHVNELMAMVMDAPLRSSGASPTTIIRPCPGREFAIPPLEARGKELWSLAYIQLNTRETAKPTGQSGSRSRAVFPGRLG